MKVVLSLLPLLTVLIAPSIVPTASGQEHQTTVLARERHTSKDSSLEMEQEVLTKLNTFTNDTTGEDDAATGASSSSLRALKTKKKSIKAPTCPFAKENMVLEGDPESPVVYEMGGEVTACVKTSDKYCGDKFRLLPPDGSGTCNVEGDEMVVSFSTSGKFLLSI